MDTLDDFVFDKKDEVNSDDETPTNASAGFFTVSPNDVDENLELLLSPSSFSSRSAKLIQKEELWRKTITPKPAGKRRASQEESPIRRTRPKSVSCLPVRSTQ